MFKSYRIGSLFGVPIKLDVTFLLILPVFAWLIAGQFADLAVTLDATLGADVDGAALEATEWIWILGILAALGLFSSVLLHELGHALTAIRYGVPIDSITLWLLGGVAQLSGKPDTWRQEFTIAVAGPIVSVAVGIGSYALMSAVPASADAARFLFGYLALMNVVLAAFNMLPAFPLDGGRVLRALLARNRPYAVATAQAARVGQLFAILLGFVGIVSFAPSLIAVALFVYVAAAGEARQTALEAAVGGLRVGHVMTPREQLVTIEPDATVADALERMFRRRHTGLPVVERRGGASGSVVGIVTIADVRDVRAVERDAVLVEDVMTTDLEAVRPDDDVVTALFRLQRSGVRRLLVTDELGGVVGLVTQSDLNRALSIGMIRGTGDDRDPVVDETRIPDPETTSHRW